MGTEKEAMEIAEATREIKQHDGFISQLFLGNADFSSLFPWCSQPEEDYREADEWLDDFNELLHFYINPEEIDRTGMIPDEFIAILKKRGAFGIKIPKEYGGLGFSQSNYRRLAHLLGRRCANVSALLSAHNSLGATLPLMKYGTDEQKKRFLPRLAKGAISAFALTENGVGSDPSGMKTYARRLYTDEERMMLEGYELCGEKIYTTNAMTDDHKKLAEVIVVVARIVDDPKEVEDPNAKKCFGLFLVESDMQGYSVPKRFHFSGLRAIYNGKTEYDRVRVPVENRIGDEGEGFRIALQILTIGRLTIPALCVGGLQKTLQMARDWGLERVQWGKPIGEHELMSKKIVDIAARTMVLKAITEYCSLRADNGQDVRIESAASKVIGTEYLWDSINDVFQLRGGRAYETAECLRRRGEKVMPIERMLRDSRINLVFEGTNEILRLWMAREGMDEYVKRGMRIASKDSSFKEKTGSAFWLVSQLVKSMVTLPNGCPKQSKFQKYLALIKREAKRLAKDIVLVSMKYQTKLQKKQLILAGFVNRTLALFEMAIAISYAEAHKDKPLIIKLTDYFCSAKMEQLHPPEFKAWAKKGSHKNIYRLAKSILDGEEGLTHLEWSC